MPNLSEAMILACIDRHFKNTHQNFMLARGDDCAVLASQKPLCISSDLFVEDIHFRRNYFPPDACGHKALAVNISDLAACGAKPMGFSLCLGLSPWVDLDWLEQFFVGMASLAGKFDMLLCGGDLSRADKLVCAITVFGECAPESHLRRGKVCSGDAIFVIGRLGLARVGLELLEKNQDLKIGQDWPLACKTHLYPEPRVEAGLILAQFAARGRRLALMDVSDGLAADLPRLLAGSPETGASLEIELRQLDQEVIRHARLAGTDPATFAYAGGEDYALLGACEPQIAKELAGLIPDFMIFGQVTRTGQITCNGRDMGNLKGFDHFT